MRNSTSMLLSRSSWNFSSQSKLRPPDLTTVLACHWSIISHLTQYCAVIGLFESGLVRKCILKVSGSEPLKSPFLWSTITFRENWTVFSWPVRNATCREMIWKQHQWETTSPKKKLFMGFIIRNEFTFLLKSKHNSVQLHFIHDKSWWLFLNQWLVCTEVGRFWIMILSWNYLLTLWTWSTSTTQYKSRNLLYFPAVFRPRPDKRWTWRLPLNLRSPASVKRSILYLIKSRK